MMTDFSPQWIPLVSAAVYAVAALVLKRATKEAGDPWRVNFLVNGVLGLGFSLLWFLPSDHPGSGETVGHAIICGGFFFIGQVFTFLALSRGDVSVATPVLGTKVIFVAWLSLMMGVAEIAVEIWVAVGLTALGMVLLGGGGKKKHAVAIRGIIYGCLAAGFFALTDVLQQRWINQWGFAHYAATMFLTIGVLSVGLIPWFGGSLCELSRVAWRGSLGGGLLLAIQAAGVTWSIGTLGATTTNVLYNSRGIWSVVLVWAIGGWFGNAEREHGAGVMGRRLAGAGMLLVAIVVVTWKS